MQGGVGGKERLELETKQDRAEVEWAQDCTLLHQSELCNAAVQQVPASVDAVQHIREGLDHALGRESNYPYGA